MLIKLQKGYKYKILYIFIWSSYDDMNYHVNYFELQLVFDESLWPGIRLTNSTYEPLFNSADTPTGNNELQRR